jgi:bifunctional non-homologous end joining protein LigD
MIIKFVLDRHEAIKRGLHWDLRFEIADDKWASFSMNQRPPSEPGKRLYVPRSNDHSKEGALFVGEIPKGEYGAGKIIREDQGDCEVIKNTSAHIVVDFKGKKIKGVYHFINTSVFGARSSKNRVYSFFKGKIK